MIAFPDEFPSVFEGSAAHERAKASGEVRVYTERGADDEAELARRGFQERGGCHQHARLAGTDADDVEIVDLRFACIICNQDSAATD